MFDGAGLRLLRHAPQKRWMIVFGVILIRYREPDPSQIGPN
jgi:hypothetical protein